MRVTSCDTGGGTQAAAPSGTGGSQPPDDYNWKRTGGYPPDHDLDWMLLVLDIILEKPELIEEILGFPPPDIEH